MSVRPVVSVSRPLAALSLLVPALVYIAYRWRQARTQEQEELEPVAAEEPTGRNREFAGAVQERLLGVQSARRARLETLEEEVGEEGRGQQAAAPDITEKGEEVERTKVTEAVFACTDIRYRHRPISESIVIDDTASEMVDEVIEEGLFEEALTAMEELEIKQEAKVPSVLAALQDPLCLASPPSPSPSYSSSPVKSEASSEGRQSTEWSDLIEQDERESFGQVLSSKLSGLELGRGRSGDSGVVSPSEASTEGERERLVSESNSKTRSHSGEDAGIGSEQGDIYGEAAGEVGQEDGQLMSYQFHIPDYLCGKLIGVNGAFIKKLNEDYRCNIVLKETDEEPKKVKRIRKNQRKKGSSSHYREEEGGIQVCSIEGTRTAIDKCLDTIKHRFLKDRSELSFEQINLSGPASLSMTSGSVSLSLAEGCMHEVFVSSIVGGGHVFLQQPYHPTFHALERLDACMNKIYSQFVCPALPLPVQVNTVCVAAYEGGWYRCQVVSVDPAASQADIKYLDYGGYHTLPWEDLKQIRTDFLSLPFQAIECYLANISPKDDENVSAFVLEELIAHQIVQARMIGTNESGVPMIHLYRAAGGQTTMVNRELVDRRCALWLETTIVQLESGPTDLPANAWVTSGNFQSMSLLPDPSNQVNPIFYAVPEAAMPEAVVPEAVVPEAAVPEAVVPEAAVPEAAVPEAMVPEAGSSWQEQYRAPGTLHSLGDFCMQ